MTWNHRVIRRKEQGLAIQFKLKNES